MANEFSPAYQWPGARRVKGKLQIVRPVGNWRHALDGHIRCQHSKSGKAEPETCRACRDMLKKMEAAQ